MIVACFFDGDDDQQTAWEQHGVYVDALQLIVGGCRAHVTFATTLLDLPWPKCWPASGSFDHRTLQRAHDLLAAAWRFRTDVAQPPLPFDGRPASADDRMGAWLDWLRADLSAWQQQPRLIALVMTILAEQNTEAGYLAEDELAASLQRRFDDVPWCRLGERRASRPRSKAALPSAVPPA